MTIQHGKFNLSIYQIEHNPYSDIESLLERAAQRAAPQLEEVRNLPDGISCGFASGKILLESAINLENSCLDDRAVLNLRSTVKRIDAGMLKALIQREEEAYKKCNALISVPNKIRKQIKADSVERLMQNAAIGVRGTEFVIDDEWLLIGATSDKDCDAVAMYLGKDLGILSRKIKHANVKGDSFIAGREFLTWLFARLKRQDPIPGDAEFMIEGPMELFAADDRVPEGASGVCTKAKIEGETVTNSAEIETMIWRAGKMIRKAKLTLAVEERIWRFTFDADAWSFNSVELPDDCETFADRIAAIRKMADTMDGVFNVWKTAVAVKNGIQELPNMEEK